jgi:PPM family protein phosphatase
MQIHWSGMTHPGRVRQNNEDAFLGLIIGADEAHYLGKEGSHSLADKEYVFAVSDGMGGANLGEFASRITLQSILKNLPPSIQKTNPQTVSERMVLLSGLIQSIHREIQSMGRSYEECRGMGATLSMVWIRENSATFAHVGDSRIYHLPESTPMVQITDDHSRVGRLKRQGVINEREAKNHPERNVLDQSLGGFIQIIEPQIGSFILSSGDALVICSDGICDGLFDRTIENIVRRPTPNLLPMRPSERLVSEAMFNSGRDNLTTLVLHFSD